jgi:hypothetical protein
LPCEIHSLGTASARQHPTYARAVWIFLVVQRHQYNRLHLACERRTTKERIASVVTVFAFLFRRTNSGNHGNIAPCSNAARGNLSTVWQQQTAPLGDLPNYVIKGSTTPYPAFELKYRAPSANSYYGAFAALGGLTALGGR